MKRRQQAMARLAVSLVILLILAFIVVSLGWWGYRAFWAQKAEYESFIPSPFLVTTKIPGIILRDEMLVVAPQGGRVTAHVKEGEEVEIWQPVVGIDNAVSSQTLLAQREELEKQLHAFDTGGLADIVAIENSVLTHAAAIQSRSADLRNAINRRDYATAARLEREIRSENTQRLKLIAERGQMPENPEVILEKLAHIAYQMELTATELNAPREGIVSYYIDGAEHQYHQESFYTVNRNIISVPPVAQDMSRHQEVKAGSALFKVVNPGAWRWTGIVPLKIWQRPSDYILSFMASSDNPTEPPLRLYSWLVYAFEDPDSGFIHITVEFPRMLPLALRQRGLELEYIEREGYGIIIEQQNLLQYQNKSGILVVAEDGLVSFLEVKVSDSDGVRVLLGELNHPLQIITNPSHRMIGLTLK